MGQPQSRMLHRHRGFTLPEMLVCVAIIAMLIAVLLPSLVAARAEARRVVCMSNQRQIGESIANWSLDHQGRIPCFADMLDIADSGVCQCPEDHPPSVVPSFLYGHSEDKPISFEVNREYDALDIRFDQIVNVSSKIYTYDGDLGANMMTTTTNGVTTTKQVIGSVSVDGNQVTIIHIPPGNPGAAHEMTVGLAALQAHIGHGDLIGTWPSGAADLTFLNYAQGKFKRRHSFRANLGNVLYLDGHVESRQNLTADMFVRPDGHLIHHDHDHDHEGGPGGGPGGPGGGPGGPGGGPGGPGGGPGGPGGGPGGPGGGPGGPGGGPGGPGGPGGGPGGNG